MRSSLTSTADRLRGPLLALLACTALAGCADFTVQAAAPAPTAATLALPPIGYNHRYGNTPVAAHDGFIIERALYSTKVYWEVAIRTDPVQAGYVSMADSAAVTRARHAVTKIALVIATEDRRTITGLLACPGNDGQAAYAEALLDRLRAIGYDHFTSAQVLVFFTESDEHAVLDWSPAGGYTYKVNDNNLAGTALKPAPGQTPLPAPAFQ